MTIESRFIEAFETLEKQGIIPSRLDAAKKLGFNAPTALTEVLKGRTKVSSSLLQNFCAAYEVNPSYLVMGYGPLLLSDKPVDSVGNDVGNKVGNNQYLTGKSLHANAGEAIPTYGVEISPMGRTEILEKPAPIHDWDAKHGGIPLIQGQYAYAGYLSGYADPEYYERQPVIMMPGLRTGGSWLAFEVAGESMYPTLYPGDILVCQQLTHHSQIKDDYIYVVVTKSDGIVVKRVYNRRTDEKTLYLKSDNPQVPPYTITNDEVLQVWAVKRRITAQMGGPNNVVSRVSELEYQLHEQLKRIESLEKHRKK